MSNMLQLVSLLILPAAPLQNWKSFENGFQSKKTKSDPQFGNNHLMGSLMLHIYMWGSARILDLDLGSMAPEWVMQALKSPQEQFEWPFLPTPTSVVTRIWPVTTRCSTFQLHSSSSL